MPTRKLPYALLLAGLVITGWSAVAEGQTYVNPSTPFGGPIAPPLNGSITTQHKAGSLGVGTTANPVSLCLNSFSPADSTNCIAGWSALGTIFGGPFVGLSQDSWDYTTPTSLCDPIVMKANCPADYTSQSGFVHAQATGTQAFTTIAKSADLRICSYEPSQLQLPGRCLNGPKLNQDCFSNADCGYTSVAVYANDAGDTLNTAGYFSGVTLVTAPANTDQTPYGRICLNGTPDGISSGFVGPNCVELWGQITNTSTTALYVKRQTTNPPTLQQSKGAAISGVANFGAAIAGDPNGFPLNYTCGDGYCSSGESALCPVDCASIPTPGFSASLVTGKVDLNIRSGSQSPPGNVTIIVARTASSTSTFQPLNGVTYTAGQVIGANTIVYVASVAQNNFIRPHPLDTLPGGGTYTYRAFQANAYPIYGLPATATLGPIRQLLAQPNIPNAGGVNSSDGQISCFQVGDPQCRGFYLDNQVVPLTVELSNPSYTFVSWSNCSPSNQMACSVQMSGDQGVIANFIDAGGPGGGGIN